MAGGMAGGTGRVDRIEARRRVAAWCCCAVWAPPALAAARETVVLAAEDDWAPFSSARRDQSQPVGFAVDLVREAFGTQGVEVKFQVAPFPRCMYLARLGAVAGCFNATIVDGNRDLYTWHGSAMFKEDLAVFGPASSPRTDLRLQDLEGKRVGYTLGYTYFSEFFSNPRIDRRGVRSDGIQLQMLAAGRLDYIVLNTMVGYLRINRDPLLKGRIVKVGVLSTDGFWVAFSKARLDSRRLADVFEKGLRALKASGRYAAMYQGLQRSLGP